MEQPDPAKLRPTFTVPVALPRDETLEVLRAGFVARPELSGRWRGKGRWAELYVPIEEKRLWSPYLSVRVDEEEDGSSIFGRFSPHPEVWTFFLFAYALVLFVVVLGGVLAYVQWTSGTDAWSVWSVALGIPLLLLLHVVSWIGQRLSRYQMTRLRAEIEDVLLDLGDAVQ